MWPEHRRTEGTHNAMEWNNKANAKKKKLTEQTSRESKKGNETRVSQTTAEKWEMNLDSRSAAISRELAGSMGYQSRFSFRADQQRNEKWEFYCLSY